MPFDIAGISKLLPDATMRFKWEHSHEGTIAAGEKFNIRPVDCEGLADLGLAKSQGYMCDRVADWRNIEQKIYFDGDAILLHLGGIGTDANPCTGFAYQVLFQSSGIVTLRKKLYHGNVIKMKEVDNGSLPGVGEMKGVAFLRYNVRDDTMVRMEAHVDKGNNNIWRRVFAVLDNGIEFGPNITSRCGGDGRAAGTWGFPAVIFHNTSSEDFNYKHATAREVNPGGVFNEAGAIRGKAPPRGGGGGTPLPGNVT